MDNDPQASAQVTRRPRTAILNALTPDEKATYRRWACAVLACYCLLLVGIAVLTNQSAASSVDEVAQASAQRDSPIGAGR
jgi:hypothetical protein